MLKRITKRDILFFFLGIVTMILIEVVSDWDAHVNAFKKGYNEAHEEANRKDAQSEQP